MLSACLRSLLTMLSLVACGDRATDDAGATASTVTWDTTQLRLVGRGDTVTIRVELAVRGDQQTMGLMERGRLPDDAGMLFVYTASQPASSGFWMYRTRIPLDIAFADSTGVIGAIRRMEPCPTTIPQGCPVYEAGVSYHYALEVNAGFFARHGIGVGGRLLVQELSGR